MDATTALDELLNAIKDERKATHCKLNAELRYAHYCPDDEHMKHLAEIEKLRAIHQTLKRLDCLALDLIAKIDEDD